MCKLGAMSVQLALWFCAFVVWRSDAPSALVWLAALLVVIDLIVRLVDRSDRSEVS